MIEDKTFRAHHSHAYRWSLMLCNGEEALAKDILQDVYVKILEEKAIFLNKSSIRTWLFSLIRNTAADHFRKKGKSLHIELSADADMVISAIPTDDGQENEWKDLIDDLSPMQRAVLQLIFYHACTVEESATILQIQIGTARTHYKRGKDRLRELIRQKGIEQKLRNHE